METHPAHNAVDRRQYIEELKKKLEQAKLSLELLAEYEVDKCSAILSQCTFSLDDDDDDEKEDLDQYNHNLADFNSWIKTERAELIKCLQEAIDLVPDDQDVESEDDDPCLSPEEYRAYLEKKEVEEEVKEEESESWD